LPVEDHRPRLGLESRAAVAFLFLSQESRRASDAVLTDARVVVNQRDRIEARNSIEDGGFLVFLVRESRDKVRKVQPGVG
jgi:hypothetical protein